MFTEKQKGQLRLFGSWCYWHGEDTGDYDMRDIDDLIEDLWEQLNATADLGVKRR